MITPQIKAVFNFRITQDIVNPYDPLDADGKVGRVHFQILLKIFWGVTTASLLACIFGLYAFDPILYLWSYFIILGLLGLAFPLLRASDFHLFFFFLTLLFVGSLYDPVARTLVWFPQSQVFLIYLIASQQAIYTLLAIHSIEGNSLIKTIKAILWTARHPLAGRGKQHG